MSIWRTVAKRFNRKVFVYIVCILLPFILAPLFVSPHKELRCAFVMILMISYWLLEPVSIVVTALLPVVLFPVLGIVGSADVCTNYMKEPLVMFMGSILLAIAVEECRLHERIALKVLLIIGTDIKWLMLGFMLTTMFLSMWMSNTGTTALMLPIVDAVLNKIDNKNIPLRDINQHHILHISEMESKGIEKSEDNTDGNNNSRLLKVCLLLSICYSANIGGTGTLTGTAVNLIFKGILEDRHPDSDEITFVSWMLYNVPGMLLCVLIGWFYLWMLYVKRGKASHNIASRKDIHDIISKRYAELRSMTCHEVEVMCLFLILVFLWVFRDPKFITGWAEAIGSDKKIGDAVPALAVSFLLFFLPSNLRDMSSPPILEWKTAQAKFPWGVIILCGGGFALSDAAQKSGLSKWVGEEMSSLQVLPPVAIVFIACLMTATMTEVMSNSATVNILLPILHQLALSLRFNPLFIMLPVTVTCSYAFMLPIATAPNAIVFQSGNMKAIEMAKPGLIMNLVCCMVQMFMLNTLGVFLFDLNTFPKWANVTERRNSVFVPGNNSSF